MGKADISPAIATRGMLNHNFVDANFPKYCMGEKGKKKKNLTILVFSGCIQNLVTLALKAGEKSVMDFYKKKKKEKKNE